MTVQVLALRYSRHNDAEFRHVSITIITISILFCICNSMMSIMLFFHIIPKNFQFNMSEMKLFPVVSNTLPLLNAVLTPVILVSRSVNRGVIHSPFECSSHCCYPGISECKYESNTLPLLNAVLTPVILVSRSVNRGVIHSPF